jgi:hypothetical protein
MCSCACAYIAFLHHLPAAYTVSHTKKPKAPIPEPLGMPDLISPLSYTWHLWRDQGYSARRSASRRGHVPWRRTRSWSPSSSLTAIAAKVSSPSLQEHHKWAIDYVSMEEEALVIYLHTQLNDNFVRRTLIDVYAAHRLFPSSSKADNVTSLISVRGRQHPFTCAPLSLQPSMWAWRCRPQASSSKQHSWER